MGRNIWMFAGQGTQYIEMGRGLYDHNDCFKFHIQLCDEITSVLCGRSFLKVLYGSRTDDFFLTSDTRITNAAIFSVQLSLARMLVERGVRPDQLIGYSLGEFVAHTVSRALNVESTLAILIGLVDVFEECSVHVNGSMTAILANKKILDLHAEAFENCWLSGVNNEENIVISSTDHHLTEVESFLASENILFQRLPVEYPFHSPLIDAAKPGFLALCERFRIAPADIPVYSSRGAGQLIECSPTEMWNAIRDPIRFDLAVRWYAQSDSNRFIDFGPTDTLYTSMKEGVGDDCVKNLLSPFTRKQMPNLKSVVNFANTGMS